MKRTLFLLTLAVAAFAVTYALTDPQEGGRSPNVRPAREKPPQREAPKLREFQPTIANDGAPPGSAPPGMVWIPGGEFSMGSEDPRAAVCGGPDAMPDARPIHRVYVDGFWMDRTEVTNRQFA